MRKTVLYGFDSDTKGNLKSIEFDEIAYFNVDVKQDDDNEFVYQITLGYTKGGKMGIKLDDIFVYDLSDLRFVTEKLIDVIEDEVNG